MVAPPPKPPAAPTPVATAGKRWRLAAELMVAVAVGLAVAAVLSPPDAPNCENPDSDCSVFEPGERRARDRQMAMIGGSMLVVAVEFAQWLGTWGHGRRLLMLLAGLSLLAAAVMYLLSKTADPDERDGASR